jgi:DNA-binding MarR family transcriptional regulator
MLTPKQLRCIELLASEVQQKDIAKELGISDRTIQRWLKLDEFKDALEGVSYRPVAVSAVEVVNSHEKRRERLEKLLDKAVDMLEATLDNPDARTVDKLKACQLIGDWSGAGRIGQLDEMDAFARLCNLDIIPEESMDRIIEGHREFKKVMSSALSQRSLPSEGR